MLHPVQHPILGEMSTLFTSALKRWSVDVFSNIFQVRTNSRWIICCNYCIMGTLRLHFPKIEKEAELFITSTEKEAEFFFFFILFICLYTLIVFQTKYVMVQ